MLNIQVLTPEVGARQAGLPRQVTKKIKYTSLCVPEGTPKVALDLGEFHRRRRHLLGLTIFDLN